MNKTRRKILKIGAAVVSSMLIVAMVIGLIPSDTVRAAGIADYSTDTKYTESLGDNSSTEYSGRIWSDKSVYSDSATFKLYTPEGEEQKTATVKKDDNSDFLVAFSTLGSSQAVSGNSQAPVDVVFVIDTSGSMTYAMSSKDTTKRIANTIKALNKSIEDIMNMNEHARVGVVAFSYTAEELLPLGRYEKGTKGTITDYFSLSGNTINKHVIKEGTTQKLESYRNVTGGTNIQMGLYTGLNILAREKSTTVNIEGTNATRVPSLVLLSDGSPTLSSSSSTWWAPDNNGSNGNGEYSHAGNGMKALMTGAYMKERVDANYGIDSTVYTIGMGIKSVNNYIDSIYDGAQDLAYMTLDPAKHWEHNNDMAKAIRGAWATYTKNDGKPSLNINWSTPYTFNHPTQNDIDDLDNADSNVNPLKEFVDAYFDADSATAVTKVFDQIVTNISISTPQVPTAIKGTDPVKDGYITYTDPIGEYMEVKDVKEIIYAGSEYKAKTKSQKDTDDGTATIYSYVFSGKVNSPVYGDQEIKDIIIEVSQNKTTKNETLTVKVPASVIPVRVNTVTLNEDGTVKSHTHNGAYPIRVLYTVGLRDDITKDGIVQTDKLTQKYISKNTNADGTINFYSNLYTGENKVAVLENGKEVVRSVGNATVEFEPSRMNSFYYMTVDMPMFKDKTCTKASQVTVAEGLEDDRMYYYTEEFYHGNEVEISVVARTGAQLKKTDIIEKGEYLYRAKGSPRLNRVLEFRGKKIDNHTKTADDFYAPTFQYTSEDGNPYAGKYVIYLGNNGVISVVAQGILEIEKQVEADVALNPSTKEFEFTVNFNGNATLEGEFGYDVVNAEGAVLRGDSVADGGKIILAGGEKAVIRNLPANTTYEVIEKQANTLGFTTEETGATGTIEAGETSKAKFVNTYTVEKVTVGANDGFRASKMMNGRHWNGDSFTFVLQSTDPTSPMPEGSNMGLKEIVISEGNHDYKVGDVITEEFGDIQYEKPGTYIYTIAEKMPATSKQYLPGLSYSGAIYQITVTVVDNGTGKLEATSVMTRTNNDVGARVDESVADKNATFVNTYSANSTAWTPVGTKQYEDMSGAKPMTDRMFQFKISTTDANAPMPTDREVTTDATTGARSCIAYNIGNEIAYPQITFEHIHATTAGTTYNYKFTEVNLGENGMTYDGNTFTVSVTAYIDSTSNAVKLAVNYANDNNRLYYTRVEFENKYEPTPVKATIEGSKTLEGRTLKADDNFKFNLEAANDAAKEVLTKVQTKEVTGVSDVNSKAFKFNEMTFTKPGTYVFNVTEQNAGKVIDGITYDAHTEVVTIVVKDNKGVLEVESITYSNGRVEEAPFVNKYDAEFTGPSVSLTGTKKLTGRSFESGEFFFVVEPKGNAPIGARATLSSAASDGTINLLNEATYDAAGTYEYWFYEQIPANAIDNKLNGVTYDTSVYKYVVKVIDDLKGNLVVESKKLYKGTKDADGTVNFGTNEFTSGIEFKNEYHADPAVYTVPLMYKILDGSRATALQAGEFEFAIDVEATTLDGTPIRNNISEYIVLPENAKNQSDADLTDGISKGEIDFGDITFYKEGIYTIKVSEVEPTAGVAGVTYTDEVLVEVFRVTDNGLGKLDAKIISLQGHYTFTNTYKSEGAFQLEINKEFTGRANDEWLDTDKFSFEVVILDPTTQAAVDAGEIEFPSDNDGVQKVELTKNKQSAKSPEIKVYKGGVYKFIVREVTGTIPGVNYDSNPYEVVVTARDNSDGTISITTNIPNNSVTFKNVYDPGSTELSGHDNLTIEKEFVGRENNEWLDTDAFTFTLAAADKTTEDAVKANDVVLPTETTLVVTNENKARSHFGNITFKEAGTYKFTVTEEDSKMAGVIDDSNKVRTIIVNVIDDGKGVLKAEVASNSDSLKFKNTYITDDATLEGKTNLVVEKILTGRDWFENDEFTFTLVAYDDVTKNAVEPTDSNKEATVVLPDNATGITATDANHKANFGDILFKEVGTYTFQIQETPGNVKNVAYDTHSCIVTVVVTDNKEGELVATPSYSGKIEFENIYTPDPVTATLVGKKTLNGRTLKAGEFRFYIEAAEGTAQNTPMPKNNIVANVADGSITYATVTYTEVGTYKYLISEIEANLAGVTCDKDKVEATVEVTYDHKTGKLVSEVTYKKSNGDSAFEFVNTYITEETDEISISAKKKVTGNEFAMLGNDFCFELEPAATNPKGDPIQKKTVYNDTNGIVELFDKVSYKQAGTYVYTVHEMEGKRAGIIYDDSVYTITVVVTDNENIAKLSADVTIEKIKDGTIREVSAITFENEYDPEVATALIHGHKVMDSEHKNLEANEFEFEIKAITENAPMPEKTTVKNAGTGLFQFGLITYTEIGTYEYEISEVIPSEAIKDAEGIYTLNGKSYDDAKHKVIVTVDDKDENGVSTGQLKAVVKGIMKQDGNPLVTFTNGYVPNSTSITIDGVKKLTGRDINAGEFEFEIKAVTEDAPMPKETIVKNVAAGKESAFAFDAITFDKAGEYVYTVVEKTTGKGGVTYDEASFVAKVTVTDEGYDGQLDATVTYFKDNQETKLEFVNSYKADPTDVKISMLKKLEGRPMKDGEFEFEIKAVTENAPMPKESKVVNSVAGEVSFGEITYEEAGTYVYEISEVKGEDAHVTYDESKYTVTVTVTDNLEGKLEAKAEGIEELIFNNIYAPDPTSVKIGALKKLTGRDLKAGEFRFVLEDEEGNKMYAENAADGKVLFDEIKYDEEGTYVYKLYEEKGKAAHVTYDSKVYTVTVVVEDLDGVLTVTSEQKAESFVFNNVYDNPEEVDTGDATRVLPILTAMLLAAGYILVTFVRARRR